MNPSKRTWAVVLLSCAAALAGPATPCEAVDPPGIGGKAEGVPGFRVVSGAGGISADAYWPSQGEGLIYDLRMRVVPPANALAWTEVEWADSLNTIRIEGEPVPPPPEGTEIHVEIQGLEMGTTYYFAIKGILSDMISTTRSCATMTTVIPDSAPPATIGDLAADPGHTSASSIRIQWTAPGDLRDDGSPGGVTQYRIRYLAGTVMDWNAGVELLVGTVQPAGFLEDRVIEGLEAGTVYVVAVRAEDGQGNLAEISNSALASTSTAASSNEETAGGASSGGSCGGSAKGASGLLLVAMAAALLAAARS